MAVVLDARKSSPDHLRNYLNPDKNTSSTNDEMMKLLILLVMFVASRNLQNLQTDYVTC